MSTIDHQNAHRLIQESLTIPLSEEKQNNLDAHLDGCTECKTYIDQLVAMEDQLRWSFHNHWDKISGPSVNKIYAITEKMESRLRRRGFINYLGVATFTIALVILIITAISVLPDRSVSLTRTQILDNADNNTSPSFSSGPEKTDAASWLASTSVPTEHNQNTKKEDADQYQFMPTDQATRLETFADVDLNCDGSVERILVEPGSEPHYFNNNPTVVRIFLETGSELNPQSMWDYSAQDASVSYLTPLLIQIEECQYFLSVLGDEGPGSGLKVFQWNGETMKEVLKVPGRYLFVDPEYLEEIGITIPPNSLSIMSLVLSEADANNVWVIRVFQWDGVEFNQVIRKEVRHPGGG
jgi:hypothetical protein